MSTYSQAPFSFLKVHRAANVIADGGIVAHPTEAVYGLGCDPLNLDAVERILRMKRRRPDAGLILIAADASQLYGWIDPTAEEARHLAQQEYAVTWLITAGPLTPNWISGGRPTVAVRIVGHAASAALCRAAGTPIVSTSANLSGKPPARNELAVRRMFGTDVACVLPGPTGGRLQPSEIRDGRSGTIVRAG